MNKKTDLNALEALPVHIRAILAGNIQAGNAIESKPTQSAIQAHYHSLQEKHAPVTLYTTRDNDHESSNAVSAIDDYDYSFECHTASPDEILTIET